MSSAYSRIKRKDFLPWLFFFLAVATRAPFAGRLLLNMDSCQFALALENFDVTGHQPHPPGYFLYVMMGRFLHRFIEDPNAVYVTVSVFFSGLTVMCIYLLGKEMFERKIGVAAGLLALSSPSLWFHGAVSLTYIIEAFFSTIVALQCWRILKGEERHLWISAFTLGVAGGIRQNSPVFLFPMWLYAVRNLPPRTIVASLGLLAATCLVWFIPMVWMSGGWDAYRGAVRELWMFNTGGHGLLEGEWGYLILFFLQLLLYLIYGLGFSLFPLALRVYSMAKRRDRVSPDSKKLLFFSLWVLPAMVFYLFIFLSVQNPGYILILLPALFVLASCSIFHIGNEIRERYGGEACLPILATVVVLNTAAFFLSEGPVSHRWIRAHDRNLDVLLAEIKTFNPEDTAVFVNNLIYYSYRHIMVYMPEYRVYNVDVRTASTGERRKTFWGIHGQTFLEEDVVLPGTVTRFVTPIDLADAKYQERNSYERAGLTVRDITRSMFIASGPVESIADVYPELRVSFEQKGNRSSHDSPNHARWSRSLVPFVSGRAMDPRSIFFTLSMRLGEVL